LTNEYKNERLLEPLVFVIYGLTDQPF
jgi:hypothetical protein